MKGELYCKYNITELKSSASSFKKVQNKKNGRQSFYMPTMEARKYPR